MFYKTKVDALIFMRQLVILITILIFKVITYEILKEPRTFYILLELHCITEVLLIEIKSSKCIKSYKSKF